MNKIKLIPLALAAFMFSACSSEDTENGGGNNNVDVSYLSVNIQNVGEVMSRAEYNEDKYGGTYEDGTEAESKISDVRFYFFNADGSPYILKKSTSTEKDKNWMTPGTITPDGKDHTTSVEQITKEVLVIAGQERVAPHSVVAVINSKTLTTLGEGALSLTDLRDKQDNQFYTTTTTTATPEKFVMANSIYMKEGKEEYAVPVTGHVSTTEEGAKANPIDIYVERVAAKVNTTCDTNEGWKIGTDDWNNGKWTYQLADKLFSKYDVFVVVDGWSVADANGRATVEKATLNSTWSNDLLGINPWTTGDYHRCFWETSVPFVDGTNEVLNKPFKNISSTIADGVVYTLPNTPKATTDFADKMENSLTKVIVAAHLYYKDEAGVAHQAEICKYKGIQYLSKEDVLTVVANENKSKYFKKTTTTDPEGHNVDVYTSISKDDLTFATSAPEGSEAKLKDYEVIPQFKSDAVIYDADHNLVDVAEANKAIATEANKAQVRREGRVYYYTPIRHLASEATKLGYYGVVRNHSYKVNLQKVSGFGTPVYDPDKVIDPTLPEEENIYLAARINVLSWRVVKSDVNLDSNKKN